MTQLVLPVSLVFGIAAWTLAFRWYASPAFFQSDFRTALRPLLLIHCFRYIGMMFLIPGVTAEALDLRFAAPAAWGDLLAAILAFFSLWALQRPGRWFGIASVAIFNVIGFLDLINAVAKGFFYTPDGSLGATFWIPAVIVPLLLVTHVYMFVRVGHEVTRRPDTGVSLTAN